MSLTAKIKSKIDKLRDKLLNRELPFTSRNLRKLAKPLRRNTYKPAFTMGFRGMPRRTPDPWSQPVAPTLDEVRAIERAYMVKLHVKKGFMYFKDTGEAFTHAEGEKRRKERIKAMITEVIEEI